MNRIDRLTAILLCLQEEKISGEDLAKRFEVSRRTIMRDIQALCEMEIPIVAEWGPNGGYSLPGFTLEPLPLNLQEAFLLRLGLETLEASPRVTHVAVLESLKAKIRSLLPRPIKTQIDTMMHNVEVRLNGPDDRLAFVQPLLTALQEGRWVRVEYTSLRQTSSQLLQPAKLYFENRFWYLDAYSHERGEDRVYRVDRISNLTPADPPIEGRGTTQRVGYGDPSLPEVVIELTRRGMMEVDRTFPWADTRETPYGRELRLRCPRDEYPWLSRFITGLAAEARVLAPPELIHQIRSNATEILQRYDTPEKR